MSEQPKLEKGPSGWDSSCRVRVTDDSTTEHLLWTSCNGHHLIPSAWLDVFIPLLQVRKLRNVGGKGFNHGHTAK